MDKNRFRDKATFANINFQGPCNCQCFFCLGKDIVCSQRKNYLKVHFRNWKNFDLYLDKCRSSGIKKVYLTGQNTDPLLYKYLGELIDYLKAKEFVVGIRTNGLLALNKKNELEKLNGGISYSVHTLNSNINYKITNNRNMINLARIDEEIKKKYRVSIVVNRYNKKEILKTIRELGKYQNLYYIQLRCVATDFRYNDLETDILAFKEVCQKIEDNFSLVNEFCSAKIYNIYGIEVTLWKTIKTTINSYNYFTEGIISENYFVVEGYLKAISKLEGNL